MFIKDHSGASSSYLIIHNGISQLLDKSSQGFGIINVVQEPNKHMLVRERFKLHDNPPELAKRRVSKLAYAHMSTNL